MIPALIIMATIAYAGAIMAFSRGTLHLNPNLFGGLINAISTLAPFGLYMLFVGQRHQAAGSSRAGVAWAVFGGLCIATFTIAMAYVFSKGKNVSFVTPLIYGGAVFLASLISMVFYHEKVTLLQTGGLVFVVVGIILIALSMWKTGSVA